MKKRERRGMAQVAVVFVSIIAVAVAAGAYLAFAQNGAGTTSQTSTTGGPGIQGIVTGYVTVGPSQPVCYANQTCNVDMTGYSLAFTPQCTVQSACQAQLAALSPSGHYSILLPAGTYLVTGLSPSCQWMGCASAFPKTVTVDAGAQLVFNVDIDTGIR